MVPPTWNGYAIFGAAVTMRPCEVNPVQYQQAPVAGLSGVPEKPLGERGAFTTISGRLYGATAADLAVAINTIRSLARAGYGVLTDGYGVAWPYVRFESFQFDGRVDFDAAGPYYYSQRYTVRFFHKYW